MTLILFFGVIYEYPKAHTHTHTHTHVKKSKDLNPIQMEVKRTAWGGPVSAACLKSAQDHNMWSRLRMGRRTAKGNGKSCSNKKKQKKRPKWIQVPPVNQNSQQNDNTHTYILTCKKSKDLNPIQMEVKRTALSLSLSLSLSPVLVKTNYPKISWIYGTFGMSIGYIICTSRNVNEPPYCNVNEWRTLYLKWVPYFKMWLASSKENHKITYYNERINLPVKTLLASFHCVLRYIALLGIWHWQVAGNLRSEHKQTGLRRPG